ncbi:MAG: ribonuclease Y [Desulfobacteraceae bacterium 4484_190.3]|nr:MAG: ribonuclease Y [Desulfobacteraceae bacterium 4484_190.3]
MNEYNLLIGMIAFIIGFAIAYWVKEINLAQKVKTAERETSRILDDAKRRSETLIKEAQLEVKDKLFKMKSDFDADTKETRYELKKKEQRLIQKEENIDRKTEQFEHRERDILRKEKKLGRREEEIELIKIKYNELIEEQKRQLEKISGLTGEQAKELLVRAMENEARYEGAKIIKRIENETKEQANKKATKIMATAIQRYAGDFVAEHTVSVVQLPNDEMKGRIIGREGRNIRALEAATGIDLIIDDTPEAVILSGFNPVRREIARLSLMRLISDGRIHPARIEDVVKKVGKEVDLIIKEAGEQAAFDLGVHGIHSELINYIGRLKFRRKELLENYIKRLEDLEKIAKSFNGVANTYAIQAGRELRVIVESGIISDEEATLLSRDIAKKIEDFLTFPGQIKVMVIRETRAVEYANK